MLVGGTIVWKGLWRGFKNVDGGAVVMGMISVLCAGPVKMKTLRSIESCCQFRFHGGGLVALHEGGAKDGSRPHPRRHSPYLAGSGMGKRAMVTRCPFLHCMHMLVCFFYSSFLSVYVKCSYVHSHICFLVHLSRSQLLKVY